MNICIISNDTSSHSVEAFKKATLKNNHSVTTITWDDLFIDCYSGDITLSHSQSLKNFDIIIPRSPHKYFEKIRANRRSLLILLSTYCKKNAITLLNGDFFLQYQDFNKLQQQYILKESSINSIPTLFQSNAPFESIKKTIKLPFVAKLINGSHGKQVEKIENKQQYTEYLQQRRLDGELYLFQKFYTVPEDYRALVINKKVVGIFSRTPKQGEWRSNFAGATVFSCSNQAISKIAIDTAEKLNLDYTGIDILISPEDNLPRVIEVNTLAQFGVFEDVFPLIKPAEIILHMLEQKHAHTLKTS